MTKKEIIKILETFKNNNNISQKDPEDIIHSIELFSGIKPNGYNIPNILGYLNHPPYSDRGEILELAWYVEIFINRKCIWRLSSVTENKEDLPKLEQNLLSQLISNIIGYGLNSSWRDNKKYYKDKELNGYNQ